MGCDNGSAKGVPNLTDVIVLTREDAIAQNWNPAATFPSSQSIGLGIKGSAAFHEIVKFILAGKKDGTVDINDERVLNTPISREQSSFTQFISSWILSSGSYTLAVYAVDTEGNESNKKKVNFIVNP